MYEIRRGVGPLNPHHLSNVTASQAALPQSTCFTIILLGRTTLNKSFSYFPLQQRRVCPVWSDAVWSCVAITHPHQSNVVSAAKRHSRYSQSFAYRPSYAGVTDIPLDCTLLAKPNSERAPPLLLVGITTRRWLPQLHHAYFATFPYVQTTHHGIVLVCPFVADNFRTFVRGGDDGTQTHDLSGANRMLSQLSYVPI